MPEPLERAVVVLDGMISCRRCGGEHRMPAREHYIELLNPPPWFTHYWLCPATGQPVFIRFASVQGEPADG